MHQLVRQSGNRIITEPLVAFPTASLYGLCVFTTFRAPLADPWIQAHLERLRVNALAVGTDLPVASAVLQPWLQALQEPQVIRLSVFPAVDSLNDFQSRHASQLIMTTRPVPDTALVPLSLKTVPYQSPFPSLKHGSLAERLLLKQAAQDDGFDDVLWVNGQDKITESTTANVFFIRNNTLVTPHPDSDGCLAGVTRFRILSFSKASGISIRETCISLPELNSVEGAFLTNAAQGIVPARRINDIQLPWPSPAKKMLSHLSGCLEEIRSSLHEKL